MGNWGRIQRGKSRLKNRLRIRLRLNFDSMTCLNYLFLDFFQYRKSQADSQADSQAFFQAFFSPFGSDPWGSESRPLYFRIIASASASRLMTRIRLGSVPRIYIAGRRGRGCMENGADCIFPSTTLRPAWKKRIIFPFPK